MTVFEFEPITAEALRAEGTGPVTDERKVYMINATKFEVAISTPFGLHIEATFPTESEAWAYIAEKQPFQRLRMWIREVAA